MLIFKIVFTLQEVISYLNIVKENKVIQKKKKRNEIHFVKKSHFLVSKAVVPHKQ